MIPFALAPLGAEAALAAEPFEVSSASPRIWEFHAEHVLGTRLEIQVNTHSAVLAREAADAARAEIERLEPIFNHRRHDSELAELNRSRFAQVSPELFTVVQTAESWRSITRGAFDARLGMLLPLWTRVCDPPPAAVERVIDALRPAAIGLDAAAAAITLPSGTVLSLDAIAKGYIVDAALNAARRAVPVIDGIALSIGGDLRCWGSGANARDWCIGLPEPTTLAINAPLVDSIALRNAAIATSGRGPRDCVGDTLRSSTISPFTGQPVREILAASVVASHAMDADAIATACMILPPAESLALVERLEGVAARITDARGEVYTSSGWPLLRLAALAPEELIAQNDAQRESERATKRSPPAGQSWPTDWVLSVDYTAPPRQSSRSADFRSPYMAMWITDANNKPVRTVLMVGRELDWQRDNFVWWGMNRARTQKLVQMRSLPTSSSGRYQMYWPGTDDDQKPVPVGKYILHLETSQERGKHSYRSLPLELGRDSFRTELPQLEGAGGIGVYYGHPNARYKTP